VSQRLIDSADVLNYIDSTTTATTKEMARRAWKERYCYGNQNERIELSILKLLSFPSEGPRERDVGHDKGKNVTPVRLCRRRHNNEQAPHLPPRKKTV